MIGRTGRIGATRPATEHGTTVSSSERPENGAQPRDYETADNGGPGGHAGPGENGRPGGSAERADSAGPASQHRDTDPVPAAVRYKEIAATAASAADRMRKIESDRIADLSDEVAAGRQRIEEAERQHAEVDENVRERWDAAREALWDERWMRVPTMPQADTSAPAATPEESLRAVRGAYRDLYDALGKRRWSSAFKSPRGRRED